MLIQVLPKKSILCAGAFRTRPWSLPGRGEVTLVVTLVEDRAKMCVLTFSCRQKAEEAPSWAKKKYVWHLSCFCIAMVLELKTIPEPYLH